MAATFGNELLKITVPKRSTNDKGEIYVYVFGVLSGILMALKHDPVVMAAYFEVQCEEHTFGLPYPVLVEAILAVADFQSSICNPMVFTCGYCQESSICGAVSTLACHPEHGEGSDFWC